MYSKHENIGKLTYNVMFTYILMFTHLYSHVKNRHLYCQEPIFSCIFDKKTYKSGLEISHTEIHLVIVKYSPKPP